MAVPTLITDLSTTAASNSPAGSENVFPNLDDYVRAAYAFIAQLRDKTGGVLSSVSGTDTITASLSGATALQTGMVVLFTPAGANTGTSVTLNINSIGAKNVYYNGASLPVGFLAATPTLLEYDGTQFNIISHSKVVDTVQAQTIAGVKTFSSSPIVPTPSASDNSTKAASTAYVDSALTAYEKRTQIAAKASTSGTSIQFTGGTDGVPSWAKRATVLFDLVSTSGTDQVCIQLGTAAAMDTSGYQGSSAYIGVGVSSAATIGSGGFSILLTGAANTRSGRVVLDNVGGNTWTCAGFVGDTSAGTVAFVSGRKALSDVLTRIYITTISGTDTFDNGQITVIYEG